MDFLGSSDTSMNRAFQLCSFQSSATLLHCILSEKQVIDPVIFGNFETISKKTKIEDQLSSDLTVKILPAGDTLSLEHIKFLGQSVDIRDLATDFREIKLPWPFFWVTLQMLYRAHQPI